MPNPTATPDVVVQALKDIQTSCNSIEEKLSPGKRGMMFQVNRMIDYLIQQETVKK